MAIAQRPSAVRAVLEDPVIDSNGHTLEFDARLKTDPLTHRQNVTSGIGTTITANVLTGSCH